MAWAASSMLRCESSAAIASSCLRANFHLASLGGRATAFSGVIPTVENLKFQTGISPLSIDRVETG